MNKGSCKQETSLTQLCDKIITICKKTIRRKKINDLCIGYRR